MHIREYPWGRTKGIMNYKYLKNKARCEINLLNRLLLTQEKMLPMSFNVRVMNKEICLLQSINEWVIQWIIIIHLVSKYCLLIGQNKITYQSTARHTFAAGSHKIITRRNTIIMGLLYYSFSIMTGQIIWRTKDILKRFIIARKIYYLCSVVVRTENRLCVS